VSVPAAFAWAAALPEMVEVATNWPLALAWAAAFPERVEVSANVPPAFAWPEAFPDSVDVATNCPPTVTGELAAGWLKSSVSMADYSSVNRMITYAFTVEIALQSMVTAMPSATPARRMIGFVSPI
jgi:hypothetical protein